MIERTKRAGTLIAAAAVAMTGCGSGALAADGEASPETVTVVVENNNWQDASVYVVVGAGRTRLGTVRTMNTERFRLPPFSVRDDHVRLEVDLIGSGKTKVTDSIMVNPGDEVEWTIQNQLSLSSYAVW